MDLNPVALLPSACIPHIPKTDLREMLKIYGEADVTVSTTTLTLALAGFSNAVAGALDTLYVNSVVLVTPAHTKLPLYPDAVTPLILIGVSTSIPADLIDVLVLTVIVVVAVTPSPALMEEMPTSAPFDPTIRNSSIFG